MSEAASGATVLWGWRRERAFNVPGTEDYEYLLPIPALSADLQRTEAEGGELNQEGAVQPGVPASVTGALDVAVRASAATLLTPLENILGAVSKSTLETDVYRYVFTPDRTPAVVTSLDAIYCEPPVRRQRLHGIKLSSMALQIANNGMIPARFAGLASHGTDLSEAEADENNTGTYVGPVIRGQLRDPRTGETLHLQVTQDVAGGGLEYTMERVPSGGTPTFPQASEAVAYDRNGNAKWRPATVAYQLTGTLSVTAGQAAVTGAGTKFLSELQVGKYLTLEGETKRISAIASDTALTLAANHTAGASGDVGHLLNEDAGFWDENRDPLEVLFWGDESDHGDIDDGDVWVWDTDWENPSATYLAGQRYTSAHLHLYMRAIGASSWDEFNVQTFNPTIAWGLTPETFNGTRYYGAIDRDQAFAPIAALTRRYRDRDFERFAAAHRRFELLAVLKGQRLGTGAYHESLEFEFPSVAIVSRTKPVANPQAIVETVNLRVEAPASGAAAATVRVITPRNWTAAA